MLNGQILFKISHKFLEFAKNYINYLRFSIGWHQYLFIFRKPGRILLCREEDSHWDRACRP